MISRGIYHYNIVSAFIKSMRGSDPDAALHYLARMIDGGEKTSFISRRIMICAAEDVGLADPRALQVAVSAAQAAEMVGVPGVADHPCGSRTLIFGPAPTTQQRLVRHFCRRRGGKDKERTRPSRLTSWTRTTAERRRWGFGTAI